MPHDALLAMNASAKNMRRVCEAKEDHDAHCPYGGMAVRFRMNPYDVQRLGWEDGDRVCGLTLVVDPEIQTDRMRVECDAETSQPQRAAVSTSTPSRREKVTAER